MSFTYTFNPADSPRDAVRFLAGQISSGDPVVVQDAEVDWAITQTPQRYAAAVLVVESMLQRYAGLDAQSKTVGNLSIDYGDRAAKLAATLENLRYQSRLRGSSPWAGGVLLADKLAREVDTSLTPHIFRIGMDDDPPGSADNLSSEAIFT